MNESEARKSKEVLLEPFLRKMRFSHVKKYVPLDSKLCDIGCGKGDFLYAVRERIVEGKGIDSNVEPMEDGRISLIKSSLKKKIPLDSEHFDCVSMLAVIEHLEYPEAILKEISRILKTGGVLILTTPTPRAKPLLEFLSYKLNIVDMKQIREHKNYFTRECLKNMLENAGFNLIRFETFEVGLNYLVVSAKR